MLKGDNAKRSRKKCLCQAIGVNNTTGGQIRHSKNKVQWLLKLLTR